MLASHENALADILASAVERLTEAGVSDPVFDAHLIVAHVLKLSSPKAFLHANSPLSEDERAQIESMVKKRVQRQTFARIMGEARFCGLWFGINEATLEPRPDSEVLVNEVVKRKRAPFWSLRRYQPLRILDLGTGTGCLLLSLLRALPQATGLGVDLAPRAIEQARTNAKELRLARRSAFQINDWDEGIEETFDIVVSNPPYIPSAEIPLLIPAVRDHDPALALDGGSDGLDIYRKIIPRLPKRLKKNGLAALEVGCGQAQAVQFLLEEAGLSEVSIHKDTNDIDRCLLAWWK